MMPSIKVKAAGGKVTYNYTISTPTSPNAKSIDAKLPTILFVHSVFIAQEIWQLQFGDPQVRRFNCVAVDLREHGHTSGDKLPKSYCVKDAGDDLAKFMEALKLPPCHIVAQSTGTVHAISLAVNHPKLVVSLFLVSPQGTEELPDVAEGREEIYEYWKEGFKNTQDDAALQDAVYGAVQLGWSNKTDSFQHAMVARTYPLAIKNWSLKNIDGYYMSTAKLFSDRAAFTDAQLSKLANVPVKLVHCGNDVAYDIEYMEKFEKNLKNAGVRVRLVSVPGAPHFGCATHATEINPMIHDFVMDACGKDVPPALSSVTSAWEEDLIKVGWEKNGEEDD